MCAERKIIENLKGSVHGVAASVATLGINDTFLARRALARLVEADIVIRSVKSHGPYSFTLYKYNSIRALRKPKLTLV